MRILFVCLGSICRSPTAEVVLRALAAREAPDLALEVDSAGTAAYHVGEPPDPRTRQAAARRGYDLAPLPQGGIEDVPDPYYGGPNGFEEVLDLVEGAARGLLAHLRQRARAA